MFQRQVPGWVSHFPSESRGGEAEDAEDAVTCGPQESSSPCHLLSVTIIRMRNVRQADVVSQTDCFVTVWLPTASHEKRRTRTISNSSNPEWNETFRFQIQTRVKNVLELSVCDEDVLTPDDHLLTVLYDLTKLCFRKKTHIKFPLNPEGMEDLEVEFLLEESPGPPERLLTNGVLVSRQLSCLEVRANPGRQRRRHKRKVLTVTVDESYEQTRCMSSHVDPRCPRPDPTVFHYAKYLQPHVTVKAPRSLQSSWMCCSGDRGRDDSSCMSLDRLQDGQEEAITVNKNCDLQMKSRDCSRELDVRLGFSLCAEEQQFLLKRRPVAARALKQLLQLEEDLHEDEVPLVAIMATGGGTRSMTSMYGHLLGLQKLGILDTASYITGLSGATWTMANLYKDANWSSKNLEGAIQEVRRHVVKNKLPALTPDQLCFYREELRQRAQEGYRVTFTDLWGLLLEAFLGDEKDDCKLSSQREALCRGQNPLPIYLTINVKDNVSNQDFREWCEFTPFEVGLQKYGAFVRTEDFGSEFFMGRLMKRNPESRICYMLGLWSSIFSLNLLDAWNLSHTSEEFFHRWTRDRIYDIEDEPLLPEVPKCETNVLETTVVTPGSWLSNTLRDTLTHRPLVSEFHNFIRGLQPHTDYLQHGQFSKWKDTTLDCFPNRLTQSVNHLCLLDTAFFVNSSYPPLLRPERRVDVILHLNYCAGSQVKPLRQTCEYCSIQNIPFPAYQLEGEDENNLKECYLINDSATPDAPVVIFFPLINSSFQKYKAPGVERSPDELEEGHVNIYGHATPYATKELTYTESAFDRLVNLSEYNILNNQDTIIQALRLGVEKKKRCKSQSPSQEP
ncbi:cytosolic phospholipase A2 epsilon [Ornithorhynchus anatinus]|uniref:cytosolic phospholipase A2 epsilon n=1 Tax=Ornithorhynchus anatinus TaxID=9258 RepID=UPI0019D46194|nr:cytosolic phospholipase A2 epsilon [Ornithorhynchus anatinus]